MRILTIKCDCCGQEIEENEVFKIEHYVHVSPSFNRMAGHSKLVNGQMHSVSGRTEKMDFCLPCYNKIFEKVFELIKDTRG